MKRDRRAYLKAWREANRERVAEYQADHREERIAASAAWHAANAVRSLEYKANYRLNHRHELAAADKAYRLGHREERARYDAGRVRAPRERVGYLTAYRASHRDQHAAASAAWAAAHPESRRESARKAKARRRGAALCGHAACLVIGASRLAWATSEHTCWLCGAAVFEGANLHMDHVLPISRGGLHCVENLKPACAKCNLRKGARLAPLSRGVLTVTVEEP